MSDIELGVLTEVPLREVWRGEATHFTPWLSDNLQALSDKLGMELTVETTEGSVGDFSADIVAKDLATRSVVVIENQFGQTDHQHLGQIITYAAGLRASTVIWVAENIRPEHKVAIDLLNQGMKGILKLYALELRILKIDESRPAPVFNLICEPEESDSAGSIVLPSERELKYKAFFQNLIDELRLLQFTRARRAQPQSWYTFSSERSNVYTYAVSFARGRNVRCEIYLDYNDQTSTKELFDELVKLKSEIEAELDTPLSWERLDGKNASRIALYRPGSIDSTTEDLEEIKQWSINMLQRLKKVMPERISRALHSISDRNVK